MKNVIVHVQSVLSSQTKQGIIDEFYSLINPLMEFSPYNIHVHGITERDVKDAPTFTEIWPTLNKYLRISPVIAHNASFDMSVIRNTLDYFKLPYPEMDYLCTVKIAQKVWPHLDNHKLNTLAAHHGIRFEHHHALEDARVAAKVLHKALEEYETNSFDTFLEKCNMKMGRIYDHGYYPPKVNRSSKVERFILNNYLNSNILKTKSRYIESGLGLTSLFLFSTNSKINVASGPVNKDRRNQLSPLLFFPCASPALINARCAPPYKIFTFHI